VQFSSAWQNGSQNLCIKNRGALAGEEGESMVSLGAMFDHDQNFTYYCRLLEEKGFQHVYLIDSHIEWREASPYLTLGILNTSRATIGTCVINPVSRHPTVVASLFATLQELSGGRMILGIGKGDSSLRRLGERPAQLKEFKDKVRLIKKLANGEEVTYVPQMPVHEKWHAQAADAVTLKLRWAPKKKVPVYIAGYSPRVLQFAGEIADGVFLQIADLSTIEWAMNHIRRGAEKSGSLNDIQVVCCTATAISEDLHQACEAVRGFPAFVMNHVLDMLNYYKASELPASLLQNIDKKPAYDYGDHARNSTGHSAYVSDEMADSFTIVGSPARCAAKLNALEQLGVNQVCLYLFDMSRDAIVKTVGKYAHEIMPVAAQGGAARSLEGG
jgi:alkanesulfonate monooxygenase SsuD/methylene tetrahydromethanopterin reductase-like flavin-dependent oxidoreductase (luciferase family)